MELLKKCLLYVLLSSIVNPSDHTKCLSLSNQKCKIQSTLINLHPNACTQKFHYYPFVVKLDICAGSCNTIIDLPQEVCVSNNTENLYLCIFNMITGINESKTLTKNISRKCKCKFDGTKCESNQLWNNDKCVYIIYVKKIMFGNLLHVIVKMENI